MIFTKKLLHTTKAVRLHRMVETEIFIMKKIISLVLILGIFAAMLPCTRAEGGRTVLLDEDFSGAASGTVATSEGNSSVSCKSGMLNLSVARNAAYFGRLATFWGETSWKDYTIETRVKTEGSGATDMFGIVFRYQYPARSHSIGWTRERRQFFIGRDYLSDYSGWAFDKLFFDEPEGFNPQEWNDIKIDVQGARIILHVNGVQIFDWTAEQNPSLFGKIGVCSESREYQSFKCRFDYLKVTGSTVPDTDTSFTGIFLNGSKLLNDSFRSTDNWTLSKGYSVRENEYGNYLLAEAAGNESRAWAAGIEFDDCAADLYLRLGSGKVSALVRYVAENLYYECVLDSSGGGSVEILKRCNGATTSLGRTEQLEERFGVTLTDKNWIRVRTQKDYIGVFYGPMKQELLKVKDEGTGLLSGKFGLSVTNGQAEISECVINRATTSVTPPEMQPTMPIPKANMLHSDETASEYARIYVSPNGNDQNSGISTDAPFKTIARAIEYVGTINEGMTGNIVVEVAKGVYNLSESLVINPKQSGKNGYYVIFEAPDGATVRSGGEAKDWERYDGNIWRARPDLSSSHEGFREFYLNGLRKQRACQWITDMPDLSFYDDPNTEGQPDGVYMYKGYLPDVSDETGMCLYFNKSFTSYSCPITEVSDDPENEERYIFRLQQPFIMHNVQQAGTAIASEMYKFRIENAMGLLNESGEWYYNADDGYIYYYAEPHENMAEAVGQVPGIDNFVIIEGTTDSYVTNVKFSGFDFEYSGWEYMTKYAYEDRQPPLIKMTMPDTKWQDMNAEYALKAVFAENLKFENNKFQHTAGGGLFFENGVNNVNVTGNIFNDTGYCGVVAGTGGWKGDYVNDRSLYLKYNQHWQKDDDDRVCKNIYIANNLFNDCGAGYNSGSGVSTSYVNTLYLLHNEVYNSGSNSMQVGWGWDYNGIASLQKTCVMYNYCRDFNITGDMFDLACFYNLGCNMGENVSENYFCNDFGSSYASVYRDEGTSYFLMSENVIEDIYTVSIPYTGRAHDYMVIQNYSDSSRYADDGINAVTTDLITYEKGKRTNRANEIVSFAGLEAPYKHLQKEYINSKDFYKSYKMAAYKNGSSIAYRYGLKMQLSPFDEQIRAKISGEELYLPGCELEEITFKDKINPEYCGLCVVYDESTGSMTASFTTTPTVQENGRPVVIKAEAGSRIWRINGADTEVSSPVYYENGQVMIPVGQLYKILGIEKHLVYDAGEDIMMICNNVLDFKPDENRAFISYLSEKLSD